MNFFIIKCLHDKFTHTKYQIQGNFFLGGCVISSPHRMYCIFLLYFFTILGRRKTEPKGRHNIREDPQIQSYVICGNNMRL